MCPTLHESAKDIYSNLSRVSPNSVAVFFKPCEPEKKGGIGEIAVYAVLTISFIHAIVSILSFHRYLIKMLCKCRLHTGEGRFTI